MAGETLHRAQVIYSYQHPDLPTKKKKKKKMYI